MVFKKHTGVGMIQQDYRVHWRHLAPCRTKWTTKTADRAFEGKDPADLELIINFYCDKNGIFHRESIGEISETK